MNDSSSREIQRLWRIQKTMKEICNDRQYIVAQSELDMTIDDFRQAHLKSGQIDRPSLDFIVQGRQDETDEMLVFFSDDDSVGIKPIKK